MPECFIRWNEPCHEKTCLWGFPTRSGINRAAQPPKMARGLKFWIQKVEELPYEAKTKALISCVVTVQLICAFVFAYAKTGFLMIRLKRITATLSDFMAEFLSFRRKNF